MKYSHLALLPVLMLASLKVGADPVVVELPSDAPASHVTTTVLFEEKFFEQLNTGASLYLGESWSQGKYVNTYYNALSIHESSGLMPEVRAELSYQQGKLYLLGGWAYRHGETNTVFSNMRDYYFRVGRVVELTNLTQLVPYMTYVRIENNLFKRGFLGVGAKLDFAATPNLMFSLSAGMAYSPTLVVEGEGHFYTMRADVQYRLKTRWFLLGFVEYNRSKAEDTWLWTHNDFSMATWSTGAGISYKF